MKINFQNNCGSRRQSAHSGLSGLTSAATDFSARPSRPENFQPSTFNLQPSQRGIALVITLILLSVTLLMALAFMFISSRERESVATTTDTATARLAADSALAAAEAQVVANVFATTNPYNFGLIVSTNYINSAGFAPGYDNVNYNYDEANAGLPNPPPLTPQEFLENLTNLFYLPRAPVLISTNDPVQGRFYLDLNRNGADDPNGFIPETNSLGLATGATNFEVGDPEWIGVLERPDAPYGPDNHFLARYAFIALPVGNSLDLNAIYNQAMTGKVNPLANGSDGFFRNQGVGSWEINLAAFLADLNTNQWDNPITLPYNYYEPNSLNTGYAFEDALSLLTYRYAGNYNSLATADSLFQNAPNVFPYDGIDGYSDGPLQTTFDTNADVFPFADNPSLPWAGADNTNHFFTPEELFDPNKTAIGVPTVQIAAGNDFTGRLLAAGSITNLDTYDRYTFYRLLAQLGTDTAPESGMINLNYSNAVVNYNAFGVMTNIAIIPGAETNLVPWTAANFFTVAADRMLRLYTTNWFLAGPSNYLATYYATNYPYPITNDAFGNVSDLYIPSLGISNDVPAFGITNIPVYVNGQFVYSPAVQRVLQLAANIYDASTTNFYPDVFRPLFNYNGTNVFISGYQQVGPGVFPNSTSYGQLPPPSALPYSQAEDVSALLTQPAGTYYNNIYGVPWIIGAKKYLPGFNQFSMINSVQVERLLQVARNYVGGPVWTNHQYLMTITNSLGASFWNSYSNSYPVNTGQLHAYVSDIVQLILTNSDGGPPRNLSYATNFTFNPAVWPGAGSGEPTNIFSFIATNWANTFLPLEIYKTGPPGFAFTTDPDPWQTNNKTCDPLPQFGLIVTNWVQAFIVDNTHVIDYVQLRGPIDSTNLNSALNDPNFVSPPPYYLWSTNVNGNGATPSWGIVNQIDISSQPVNPPPTAQWNSPPNAVISGLDPITAAQKFLSSMLDGTSIFTYVDTLNGNNYTYTNTELAVQAGYTATRTIFGSYLYQVNDPLVHYLASDLNAGAGAVWANDHAQANGVWSQSDNPSTPLPVPPTGADIIKGRYQPWGKTAPTALQTLSYNFGNPYNLIYKDPLVWTSDYWDFPTNKYPTVGWLGRVHRGTPWQTVYLKAHDVLGGNSSNIAAGTNTWMAWTGDYNISDAADSAPLQDRLLFDLFTTAPNDNATRGQLSVNVGAPNGASLAAWSALFSGMVVLTNTNPDASLALKYIPPPNYNWTNIQPAGANGLNSTLGDLVTNINNMRSVFTNADGVAGMFEHKGDILSTLALTEQSPFLNWNNVNQQQYGISDEAYEWLPQQMMSLLRASDSPRYVIYCYGQALKPAPNSLVTSSQFFGMSTNYQVVSESAVRVVLRVDDAKTSHPHAVVESYNILPPD
jgi:hypothetical protein